MSLSSSLFILTHVEIETLPLLFLLSKEVIDQTIVIIGCSAIATRSLVQKKEDPGAFSIPCKVGSLHFAKALCHQGASINLMPLSI